MDLILLLVSSFLRIFFPDVLKTPTTTDITITFMFYRFSSLWQKKTRYLSNFWLSFIFSLWSAGISKSSKRKKLTKYIIIIISVFHFYLQVQHEIVKTWQRSRLSEINWSRCLCCLAPRMKRNWGRSRSYDGVARPSDISTVVSLSAIHTQDCRVGDLETNYGDKAPKYFEQQPMINNAETQ